MNQESPTLELTNDCFQFVTGFFEVINLSAPHIHHSALLLSPKQSIVQTLYGQQANPLARVIQGAPTSWDLNIANTRLSNSIRTVTWSPCSRFIGIVYYLSSEIVVLDATTFEQLHTMCLPNPWLNRVNLIYSPDSHLLTGYPDQGHSIVSWDLQTGGLISNISTNWSETCASITYSGCGTMLGCLFYRGTITVYNVLSCIQISSHLVQGSIVGIIWTHGECLQFATINSGSITIWEVSFTLGHAPIQIGSLPTPDNFSSHNLTLLPILSQLAFILKDRVLVWDAQHQRILLDSMDVKNPRNISFSSDGHFICRTNGPEFYLWKKSPDGYLPYKRFVPSIEGAELVISPNGESIISFSSSILQLWHTANSPTSLPSLPTPAPHQARGFLLEFSPDESLVAVTRRLSNTVTVFNVKSGNPQLVINADTEICGIRITESRVIIVGDGKIVTWEIPAGDRIPNAQRNINNSLQTTTFNLPAPIQYLYASISPDLNYVAFGNTRSFKEALYIYNMYTGEKLAGDESYGFLPGFTLDGKGVWCATSDGEVEQWAIFKDDTSNITRLEMLWNAKRSLSGFPWHSSYGYQVSNDGWVLSSSGKHLLWLPHKWRSKKAERRWSGRFLTLLHSGLPEAIILELEI